MSTESIPSYPFKPIDLPETATPDQLITALSKRSVLELGHFDFTVHKIVEIRSVQTEPPMSQKFTAVLLDTSDGQKVVMLQPQTFDGKWHGWYYRTYDTK